MSWQFYLTLSILFLSFNGLLHRSLMKEDKSDPIVQALAFLIMGGLFAIVVAYFRGTLVLNFYLDFSIVFILIAFSSAAAYFLKYSGFKLLNASEVVVLASTSKLWSVFGASFLLGEDLTTKKIIGALIIMFGVAIVMYKNGSSLITKGIVFVLSSAVLFAFADMLGYRVLKDVEASNFQILFYFLPAMAILSIKPVSIKKINYYFESSRAIRIFALSAFDVLGMLFLFLAYQSGGLASVIAPLSNIKIVVTVILAMIFLNEKENILNKIIGALVTTVGAVILL